MRLTVLAVFLAACSSNPPSAPASSPPPPAVDAGDPDEPAPPVARACYLDETAASNAPLGAFKVPTGKYLGLCTQQTIDDLLACTHDSDAEAPNDPHCQALKSQGACMSCIFSDRGAILEVKYPNVPGCIALALGETTATGCGAAYSDWQTCQKAGCASCFSTVKVPKADQDACVEDATTKICNGRASFAKCDALEQAPDYEQFCKEPAQLDDGYLGRLYNYFCGTAGAR